jgi:hypothetical protein
MIPKSGYRFSEKITLHQRAKARRRSRLALEHFLPKCDRRGATFSGNLAGFALCPTLGQPPRFASVDVVIAGVARIPYVAKAGLARVITLPRCGARA